MSAKLFKLLFNHDRTIKQMDYFQEWLDSLWAMFITCYFESIPLILLIIMCIIFFLLISLSLFHSLYIFNSYRRTGEKCQRCQLNAMQWDSSSNASAWRHIHKWRRREEKRNRKYSNVYALEDLLWAKQRANSNCIHICDLHCSWLRLFFIS